MANYGVVYTSNISGRNFSFVYTSDIENGTLVAKDVLATDEREIYKAKLDATKPAYLVANPVWNYDDSTYAKRVDESQYINKKNVPFRVYELKEADRFEVSADAISGTVAVGDTVGVSSTGKLVKSGTSAFQGKVIAKDAFGFKYNVGSAGQVDTGSTFYLIEVTANA